MPLKTIAKPVLISLFLIPLFAKAESFSNLNQCLSGFYTNQSRDELFIADETTEGDQPKDIDVRVDRYNTGHNYIFLGNDELLVFNKNSAIFVNPTKSLKKLRLGFQNANRFKSSLKRDSTRLYIYQIPGHSGLHYLI